MAMFVLGLFLFFSAHFITALARGFRQSLTTKLGQSAYKGLYSLISLAGLALIIFGWPEADPSLVYSSPLWLRHVTYALVFVAFVLLTAAYLPAGKIAETAKHPMLAGVKVWAFAHLLSNGEVRSVMLFGAFLIFAVIDWIVVKRRGAPVRKAASVKNDFIAVAVGAILYVAVFFYLHHFVAGIALVN